MKTKTRSKSGAKPTATEPAPAPARQAATDPQAMDVNTLLGITRRQLQTAQSQAAEYEALYLGQLQVNENQKRIIVDLTAQMSVKAAGARPPDAGKKE